MSKLIDEDESGIKHGTLVNLKRAIPVVAQGDNSCETWINIRGTKCEKVVLTFDRAAHNHHDELYSYCFTLPSTEEVWFEFRDSIERQERLRRLRDFLDW